MPNPETLGTAEDSIIVADRVAGGNFPPLSSEEHTPTAPPSGSLAERTIASLQQTFGGFGHEPSAAMWEGLRAVATTLDSMASGTCAPAVYVSSLDPGVGKTQLVVHFLRELLRSPGHQAVGAVICVNRKDQIRSIVDDAALERFAVLTADHDLNGIATAEVNEARVLFTTQQMVEARCQHVGSFKAASAFHFNGQPRAVRIWDEAMLPGQPLTVSFDELRAVPFLLRRPHRAFTDALVALIEQIEMAPDGSQLLLPDLASLYDVPLRDALAATVAKLVNVTTVEKLWHLFGRTVTVRTGWDPAILDYRDTLPDDLKPVIVLDASARVRTTYRLWSEHRGGLARLPSAQKDYSRLTINVWRHGGGKNAFTDDGITIADGVAATIRTRPGEDWLIVHHKPTNDFNFEKMVRARLSPDPVRLHFLTWGQHDATNSFANVSNVVLAGTLFKPKPVYEALGRLAADRPSSSGSFEEAVTVELGEHCHGVLQALCRGAVRGYRGGACPATQAYIVASTLSGIPQALSEMFPGASIAEWQPVPKPLKGHANRAFDYITSRVGDQPNVLVTFKEVSAHLGIDPKNLKKIRNQKSFIAALEEVGIEELLDHETGSSEGFKHLFNHYFGGHYND